MVGLRQLYSDLSYYDEQTGKENLNPLIKQPLLVCPSSSVFAAGGYSVVL